MEPKTKVNAKEGRNDLEIIREFDLPVELLFKAYVEPKILEQWMGTRVIKLESRTHGAYEFETSDNKGNVAFIAHGVIHEFKTDCRIVRTFQMKDTPFPVQLEFLEFERLSDSKSKLTMHVIYKSVTDRDNILRLPFAYGINMAHNRLESIVHKLV
ncbi:SRPBCC family protein [Desertivirga brevis]|uniref:SRPBCC family protein n=1 Tax=Desertivirga brevis TaxID=2810310 RepID=UPI001A965B41|nr:SRPBCC domain-containing protein [Pedobacter sp. SYSU D00873]